MEENICLSAQNGQTETIGNSSPLPPSIKNKLSDAPSPFQLIITKARDRLEPRKKKNAKKKCCFFM